MRLILTYNNAALRDLCKPLRYLFSKLSQSFQEIAKATCCYDYFILESLFLILQIGEIRQLYNELFYAVLLT